MKISPGLRIFFWAAAFCAVATRRLDQLLLAQFYAEDGTKFFAQAEMVGWGSITLPAGSYLHLLPRIIACSLRWLPWEWLPLVYNAVAAALTAMVALRVLLARIPKLAAVTAAVAVLAIPTSGEVFLNMCCLHFILALLIAVNLVEPAPVGRGEATRRGLEMAIAALSGAEVMVFLPLSLWRAWQWRKEPTALGSLMGLWVGALAQAVTMFSQPRGSMTDILPSIRLLPLYADALFTHWRGVAGVPFEGWLVAAAVGASFILLLRANRFRSSAVILLLGAVLFLAAGRSVAPGWANPFGNGSRYAYLPFVLTTWAIGWLLAGADTCVQRAVSMILLLAVAASGMASWAGVIPPNHKWAQQVREVRQGERSKFVIPGAGTWEFAVPRAPENGSH